MASDREHLHDLAEIICHDHHERLSGVGRGHCVTCREPYPCKPKQLAALYLDISA